MELTPPPPIGWESKPLGEFATLQRGFDLPYRLRKTGNVPIVSSAGVSDWHAEAMVAGPGVVTGRYGTIGEVFYLERDFWPLNTTLFVRDFHGNSPRFAYYLLQRFDFATHSGKSGVPGVNRNDLHAEIVTVPIDLMEQQAIARALGDVDTLLERLDQLIAKKRDLRIAVMQQLLSGETRLPGHMKPWTEARLGELGTFVKGSGVRKSEANSGALPCVRYGELYTHHDNVVRRFFSSISPRVAATATRLERGDLLFAGSGETKEEIGKCAAFSGDFLAYAGGDIVILRNHRQNPTFMGYYCNSPVVGRQKASKGQGDAVVHISARALANISVRLPSVPEQDAIAEVLEDSDAEISTLEERRAKTQDLKLAMMQELLTGKTRLHTTGGSNG